MSDVAIRTDGLGKLYRIGRRRRHDDTLRDALAAGVQRAAHAVGAFARGRSLGCATAKNFWALRDVSFIDPDPELPIRCTARLRYHARAIPATYTHGRLTLDEPFFGAAPGQAAVLYSGTRVLGGGTITL